MAIPWHEEGDFIRRFSADLDRRPALPEASPDELAEHAVQVSRLQDLLSLAASLPPRDRPPAIEWDDLLSALWRKLFVKGDDIDRYVLGSVWRTVLREAGEVRRFIRCSNIVAIAARNCYRFDEALELCREGRLAAGAEPSTALLNIVNTEGIVHYCRGDLDAALGCYAEVPALATQLSEEEVRTWSRVSREDLCAQGLLNSAEAYLRLALDADGREKSRLVARARRVLDTLDKMELSADFRRLLATDQAELMILEGRSEEARRLLSHQIFDRTQTGPGHYPLGAMQARLLSVAATLEGDWRGAYHWIRQALKEGTRHSYPAEDQLILDQAFAVVRGLHDARKLKTQEALVNDLVQLLEDKDWYTGRSHSRSVSQLAERLGRILNETMGWELDLHELRVAGLLHDIGKLRIPWSLLNKVAPITAKERSILKDHSPHGGDILRRIGMEAIGGVVEQHHETLDGSGYPRGQPPTPAAAVVGVCDVFEATVTPNRRYKDPKSRSVALGELRSAAGRLYHPHVVEALSEAIRLDAPQPP
jgi:HD-GYP domain-containing protein (c-di-GMP phosphodiesterase class II)